MAVKSHAHVGQCENWKKEKRKVKVKYVKQGILIKVILEKQVTTQVFNTNMRSHYLIMACQKPCSSFLMAPQHNL